jgi:alpha-1,6-mannosyltransferase
LNTVPQNSSRFFQNSIVILAGIILATIYSILAVKSNADISMGILDFLSGYWLAAGVLLVFWFYLGEKKVEITYSAVFFWAIVFRIIGIAGSPILEDDFYRYLLDGCLFVSSGSPYGIPPASLFSGNALSPECQAALNWVNNPDLPTIYGPLLQYLFALSHLLSPANINFLQSILVIFDLGLIFAMSKFVTPRNLLIYAWCPLAIKEIAFTAHPDIVGALLVFMAFGARYHAKSMTAAIIISLACAAKIFAFLALPFFIFRQPPKIWLTVFGVLLLLYLPFILQGQADVLMVGIFAQRWQFNPFLFDLFNQGLADMSARLLCLLIFIVWYITYFYRYHRLGNTKEIPRMDWIFGLFFLLSPVINAWYLLWLVPFAVLRPSLWAWTASLVVSLSYVTGLNMVESNLGAYQIDPYARTLEIGLICLAIAVDYRNNRFRLDHRN